MAATEATEATAPGGARAVAPILVFACGNASRGDDAVGPLLVERLEALAARARWRGAVETLTDFQLQVEHALDVAGREQVVFVDADVSCSAPFAWAPVAPRRDASFSSHALSPSAVLQAYVDVHGQAPPPCHALRVRTYAFELGAPPGAAALANLDAALKFLLTWLEQSVIAAATKR